MEKVTKEKYMEALESRIPDTFKLDPKVTITLKGNPYTLEFNNASAKGVLLDSGFNLLNDRLTQDHIGNPNIMGSLLFRGLQTNHPDLTIEETDKLFTVKHYPYINRKIMEALVAFMPDMSDMEVDEVEEKKVP